jgi:hypothetical protein
MLRAPGTLDRKCAKAEFLVDPALSGRGDEQLLKEHTLANMLFRGQ